MPFPFIPLGAMVAAVVLGGTFTLFYVVANRIDRAIGDVGGAVIGRLVTGLGDWSDGRDAASRDRNGPHRDPPSDDPPAYEAASPIPVEHAHAGVH